MGCVTRIQVLRGTSAQRLSIIPLVAELVFDTSLNMMFVGDGITYGGLPFSGEDPVVIQKFTEDANISGFDYAIADSPIEINFTLPNASTYQKPIRVKNSGVGLLNVLPVSGQLIDGQADIQLLTTNALVLVPKNGAWFIW